MQYSSVFFICQLIFMEFTVFHILTKVRKIYKTNLQLFLVLTWLFKYPKLYYRGVCLQFVLFFFFSSSYKSCSLNYLFKVNNTSTRKWCKICSTLTTKTPNRLHVSVLMALLLTLNIFHTFNFEHITHLNLMFLLLTLDISEAAFTCSKSSIEILEQIVKYVQSYQ